MIEQDKKPFRFDLQIFAEGDEPSEPTYNAVEGDIRNMLGEQAPVEPGTPPAEPPVVNPELAPIEPGTEPMEPGTPPVEPQPVPAPVNNDPMANPVVQELMNVVKQQQEAIKQQSDMMQQYIQNSMTNNAPQPSPEVIKTPEELEAEKEALMERFYSNPMDVLNEFATKATQPLQEKLDAYEAKEAWNSAIGEMASNKQTFPEFENVRVRMGEILKERPYLMQSGDRSKALADAYALAMAERGQAQTAAAPVQVNPADMMKNPEFIKQIIGNPEVMKMIAAEQAKMIQDNSQQVPPMSPSSGVANVAPFIKNSPKDYNELESDIKNSLHQGLL